ncbi:MAG: CoA-binding protein [Deltaproteobacteria bacterium]|nr:CoA-binding protein [Deltaproteobacteria bacterium]MBW2007785.1 CoA-binding protein [Deltaproteobacteria bacterium]MBW2347195.1 CoA-binding protein [Deltaproteobacteria bacterium]
MPQVEPPAQEIQKLLESAGTIAVVGCSPKPERDSHRVARYLIQQGFEVIPVNPGQKEILGRTCYRSLKEIPVPVDVADLFLNPKRVPRVVDEALEAGVKAIWMQLGVVHNESARKAMAQKVQVVMNRCIMVEHRKLKEV